MLLPQASNFFSTICIYVTFTEIDGINIFKAPVLAMLFIGGMVPVVFSALAMNAVGKAAMEMVYEVRRQFKEIPGIMEGKGKPEYDKCVDISTKSILKTNDGLDY